MNRALVRSTGYQLTRAKQADPPVRTGSRRRSPRLPPAEVGYAVHGDVGLKIAYDRDVIPDRVLAKIEAGGYERAEGRHSNAFIEDGDRIIELGAGLGFMSALITSRKQIADYVAIEADPRLFDIIHRTHDLNGLSGPLTVRTCIATCNQELIDAGTTKFYVGEKFCASSLLGARKLKSIVEVPVIGLPELIRERRANVLIVDVEGAETDIFNGSPLETVERILTEIHLNRIGREGIRDIFRNLDALGFVYDPAASAGSVCGFRRIEET